MNFSEMWQTWLKVTTNPGEPTFEAERQKPNATLSTALIWMLIVGAVTAAVGLFSSLVFAGAMQSTLPQLLDQADLPPEARSQFAMLLNSGLFAGFGAANLSAIITVPLFFLIGTGIYHLIAKLLGGTGEFGRFAYLNAAFDAPLGILTALLGLIPFVGCVTPLIAIYQLVLAYFAVKVEHQLSSGKALLVVLLPLIVLLLLFACAFFAVMSFIVQISND